jgi:hypothetical protein
VQSISPLTASQLLGKAQKMLYKFEILDDSSAWIDLCALGGKSYLTSLSLQLGGAGVSPDPIAASWSAEISNKNGIFHPLHPTSAYAGYFRVGRKVRISVGAKYGSGPTSYYWQRLIGWMDAPKFSHSSRSVSLSGSDYSKRLTDLALRFPHNYWGGLDTLDSQASFTPQGSNFYTEGDAFEASGSEANSISGTWGTDANVSLTSVSNSGGGSVYVAKMQLTSGTTGEVNATFYQSTGIGDRYQLSIKYRPTLAASNSYIEVSQTVDGTRNVLTKQMINGTVAWHTALVDFITIAGSSYAPVDVDIRIHSGLDTTDYFYFDILSLKACVKNWYRYSLTAGCNGPYYVTLDAAQVSMGSRDAQGHFDGWIYDSVNNTFLFDEEKSVAAGTDNLLVYYYSDAVPENIVADILAAGPGDAGGGAGLYANRTAALAAMSYTATGVMLDRVWFDAGTTGIGAIRMICERCNYRFWFKYDGTPCFQPAPTVGSSTFDMTSWGHLNELNDYQDLTEIKNSITIEGDEASPFLATQDKRDSKLTDTKSDVTSIGTYLEHTEAIQNHLFQDQTSLTAMAVTVLAAYKDPKWYAELTLANCPVPLEVGDTITWVTRLSNQYNWPLYGEIKYGEGTYEQAAIENTRTGIVRDISISGNLATYKVEVVPES